MLIVIYLSDYKLVNEDEYRKFGITFTLVLLYSSSFHRRRSSHFFPNSRVGGGKNLLQFLD